MKKSPNFRLRKAFVFGVNFGFYFYVQKGVASPAGKLLQVFFVRKVKLDKMIGGIIYD